MESTKGAIKVAFGDFYLRNQNLHVDLSLLPNIAQLFLTIYIAGALPHLLTPSPQLLVLNDRLHGHECPGFCGLGSSEQLLEQRPCTMGRIFPGNCAMQQIGPCVPCCPMVHTHKQHERLGYWQPSWLCYNAAQGDVIIQGSIGMHNFDGRHSLDGVQTLLEA
ncbi:hypothetical protein SELMODRAFT_406947 [Selaginella moellendorffii]|uniref:Uncharacterized protein n=1 Tax=Selaginella moellendorffii TaxID=88036 RepID=D8R3F6_SELML|nr:hypothetical protein SELMODRAFT_406947 [Selaginella moellendorffii]